MESNFRKKWIDGEWEPKKAADKHLSKLDELWSGDHDEWPRVRPARVEKPTPDWYEKAHKDGLYPDLPGTIPPYLERERKEIERIERTYYSHSRTAGRLDNFGITLKAAAESVRAALITAKSIKSELARLDKIQKEIQNNGT